MKDPKLAPQAVSPVIDDSVPTEAQWYVVHTYSGYENLSLIHI